MQSIAIYTSFIITLIVIAAVGVYTVRFVRTSSDFTIGGRSFGTFHVTGSLIGAFIGGTSIMGTAQMSYTCGISAVWFTLGGALSCVLISIFLVKPLRNKKNETIAGFLSSTYGMPVMPWVSIYIAAGMFLQVGTQVLAAVPIVTSLFPVSAALAGILVVFFIVIYIIFGGFWGASFVGIFKTVMLLIAILGALIIAVKNLGGVSTYFETLPVYPWFNMFPNGSNELAKGISTIIGFMSTQTYLQAVFAAKNAGSARKGLVISGIIIVALGIGGVAIGMFMRIVHPGIEPASALPLFLIEYLNPWFSGMVVSTLLISLLVTGAALTIGIATSLLRDVYCYYRKTKNDQENLMVSRLIILIVSLLVLAFSCLNLHSMILQWAFLSMALRGVTVFIPMMVAVFLPKAVNKRAAYSAIIFAPMATVVWYLFANPGSIDPLFVGLPLSFVFFIWGYIQNLRA